jgi:hypothetical protein
MFKECDVCLCKTCRYRGSCSYQMRDICNNAILYLMLQCPNWKEKSEEEDQTVPSASVSTLPMGPVFLRRVTNNV